MSWLDEVDIELNALDELGNKGWNLAFGPDISPGCSDEGKKLRDKFDDSVLEPILKKILVELNPQANLEHVEEAIRAIKKSETQNLMSENLRVHKLIIEGCPIEYRDERGDPRGFRVRYIDFENPERNNFLAINQFAIKHGQKSRRLDIVGFVNGLPLIILELKSPTKRWANTKGAWRQLGTYQREFPDLFAPCAIQVVGDGLTASAGTVGAPLQHFAPWKTIDSEEINTGELTQLQVLIRGMLDPSRFLDLVRNFHSFSKEDGQLVRKGAKYHQYWAVNSALESAVSASSKDGRGGIIWHTQGSGKSLEMLFLAGKLMRDARLANPTIVMLTDRNDLDDQLFDEVFMPDELLPEKPVQAQSASDLKNILKRAGGGIIFTTIQKFRPEESGGKHELLSDRRNIVVIADEAHRTQYDFVDGYARHLRDALPNATYIGFTGTPIDSEVYDLTRAVNDGATVKVYYESRLAKVALPESARKTLDEGVEELLESEENETERQNAKSRWARQVAVVGASDRISEVATDLVSHWESRRAALVGKAMVVCMSREIAVDLYDQIIKLRPDWHDDDSSKGKIKVIITGSANDPAKIVKHTHNRDTLRSIKKRAKDVSDPLEIVIVRDMWLTGFDKPMKGHSLMQAIARVNRTFRDKEGGLIVDYIGIATNLREAVAQYTKDDQDKAGIDSQVFGVIAVEKHDVVKGILSGIEWSSDRTAPREIRIAILQRVVQFLLSDASRKERFLINARQLFSAFSISGARDEVRPITEDVNFFAAVYGQVSKTERTTEDGDDRDEALDTALRQLVSEAISAEGVIDVFGNLGLPNPELSVLSPEFLDKIRKGDKTNLQFELMKKVLNDKLRKIREKNIVDARKFSEKLEESILALQNRAITTAQAIQQLIELAEEINEKGARGDQLGLAEDEVAFYDAITQNGSAVLELGDEVLKQLTHELVEVIKSNAKLDWTRKETVRAAMRANVKRLLRKYKYPPDRQESAVALVIEQAELFAADLASGN